MTGRKRVSSRSVSYRNYCIKIIQNSKEENSKDYFDQSIDEIKLLRFISANCSTD